MSAFHNQQTTADGIHILPRYTFGSAADMLVGVYTAADDGCCIQVGAAAPFTYYILKDSSNSGDLALGYVGIATGTGDFVGPAGATVGNAVSFGDATGLVGADSGRAAGNIPSSLPVGFGEGGTGQSTQQTAMEALSPPNKTTLWVNSEYTGTSTGSVNAPFSHIQDALTHIGPATTAAEEYESWVLEVAPGFYPENLIIPELRTIAISSVGIVIMSDHTLAPSHSVTMNNTSTPITAFPHLLSFVNIFLTGSVVLLSNAAGSMYEVHFTGCNWANSAFAGACIDATGWPQGPELRFFLTKSRPQSSGTDMILSNTAHPQADVGLSSAVDCDLSSGNITLGGYGRLQGCRFGGDCDFTWVGGASTGSNLDHPVGFVDCSWDNPATHTIKCHGVGDFRVDSMTYRSTEGILFAGSAAFTADPYRGLSNPYFPYGGQWVGGGQPDQRTALDRLASAVQGLLGGQIP
jgi:hypothetical protein|tara:strand:+ start:4204 stop:5595 length:1392 start_codon:yes stop_codon:yes gene_type:complete